MTLALEQRGLELLAVRLRQAELAASVLVEEPPATLVLRLVRQLDLDDRPFAAETLGMGAPSPSCN